MKRIITTLRPANPTMACPSPSTMVEESPPIQPANLAASQPEGSKPDLLTLKAVKHEENPQGSPADPAAIAKTIDEITEVLEEQTELLTEEDSTDLAKLMEVVRTGIDHSRLANEAMREIRDRRLYRGSHKTFEAFCDKVLDISEQRVSQLLKCADEIATLQENVPEEHIPSTERAIRELRRVKDPKNKAEILRIASEMAGQGRPSSATIEVARLRIEGKPEDKVRTKIVKVAEVLKAAQLVQEFIETQSFDDLKVTEYKQLGSAVNAIAQYADKLEAQAA